MSAKKSNNSVTPEEVKALRFYLELLKDKEIEQKLTYIFKHRPSLLPCQP